MRMAFGRKSGAGDSGQAGRRAPLPQVQTARPQVRTRIVNNDADRFEPGLADRWERAWNRARASSH